MSFWKWSRTAASNATADGSITFNLPDLRGYLLGGKDDMGGRSRAYEVRLFLDGMARTTTDETTPALVARGVFAMNPIAVRIHIRGSPCPT
jgi:microcystin-dependent protein